MMHLERFAYALPDMDIGTVDQAILERLSLNESTAAVYRTGTQLFSGPFALFWQERPYATIWLLVQQGETSEQAARRWSNLIGIEIKPIGEFESEPFQIFIQGKPAGPWRFA